MLQVMSFSLIVGAAACFGLLYLKYTSVPQEKRDRSTTKQRLKSARVLIIALLAAFAGLGMVLQTAVSTAGFYVPGWLAMLLVVVPSFFCTRHLTRLVASRFSRYACSAMSSGWVVTSGM